MVMSYPEITKQLQTLQTTPNLGEWSVERGSWNWDNVASELDLPDGLYNQAHECIDRHAEATPNKVAMIWEGGDGAIERYSFQEMRHHSNRFANALSTLGIGKAERVFFFTDRIPELYFACFGTLKHGAIIAPLFSAFGPEPVKERFERAEGSVIVTTPNLLPKINAIRAQLPSLRHVIVIAHRAGIEVA